MSVFSRGKPGKGKGKGMKEAAEAFKRLSQGWMEKTNVRV